MTETQSQPTAHFYDGHIQKLLLQWWSELTENLPSDVQKGRPNRRGERAELRRCRSPDEVLLTEAYHRFRKKLSEQHVSFRDRQLGSVVGLLAHVKQHVPTQKYESIGVQMAAPADNSDTARLSGLRFRRLLEVDDRHSLYGALFRVIRLLDGQIDVNRLAKDVFYWSPTSDNTVRKNWARDYYDRAPDET